MSSFISNRDIPILVTIPIIFLASKKEFRTEWENGCQKFRSERVNIVHLSVTLYGNYQRLLLYINSNVIKLCTFLLCQKELHCLFVDLEKAYAKVWDCMRKSGVAEKYAGIVQATYHDSTTAVRCAVGVTEGFEVKVGQHQGSALSTRLQW